MGTQPRHFGVERYARALVERLDKYYRDSANPQPEHERALVVGIYGQWGCGKTTWLQAIEQRAASELGRPRKFGGMTSMTVPVMFNAWQYEKEPHLIVPLLKTAEVAVRRALSGDAKGEEAYWAWVRERAVMLWDVAVALVAGLKGELGFDVAGMTAKVGVDAGKIIDTFAKRQAERAAAGRPLPSPMDAYESLYFDLHRYMQALTGRGERPEALDWLTEQEREIESSLQNGDSLQIEDLQALTLLQRRRARKQLAKGDGKTGSEAEEASFRLNVLFLIDDLDRCLPEKAVEMLESIKLFLEVPGCAFVVAVDDEIVGRGIQHRYRDYLFRGKGLSEIDKGPISGTEYLEKIVHLPVRVPALELDETRAFLLSRWPELFRERRMMRLELGAEREQGEDSWDLRLLDLFAQAVPPVPRKLIRAVELFSLLHGMAEQLLGEQRFGTTRYEPILLARLVILQVHAPDIYRDGGRRRGVAFLDELVEIKRAELQGKTLDDLIEDHTQRSRSDESPTPETRLARDRATRMLAMVRRVQESRLSRAAFDPLAVVDVAETYDWQDRVAAHYRLVASESKVDAAIRAKDVGSPTALKDVQRFLDLALAEDPSDWRRALAEEPDLAQRVLDEPSGDALLARVRDSETAKRVSLDWVRYFGPYLRLSTLAAIYRESDLLGRLQDTPGAFAQAVAFVCRAANPAHVPSSAKSRVTLANLVERGRTLVVQPNAFWDAYLVGLDVRGVKLDAGIWDRVDLRDASGLDAANTSHALRNAARTPVRWSLGFGLGARRSVCQLDDDRIAASGDDGTILVWSLAHPDADPILLRGHSGYVRSVCQLDGGRIASAGDDGIIRVWSLARPDADPILLCGHSAVVRSVCPLSGNSIASCGDDGTVRIWSLVRPDDDPLVLRDHAGPVMSVCRLDGGHIASAGVDGIVRIWYLARPDAAPIPLRSHSGPVWSVCPLDGGRIASSGSDGTVHVWSLAHPDADPIVLHGHSGPVWSVCPLDGGRIASSASDGTVRIWSLAQSDPIVLRGHSGDVWSVCQLDCDRIASAADDGTVRVWSLAQSDVDIILLRGHSSSSSVCHLNGDRIASAGADGLVRLWALAHLDADPILLRGHSGPVMSVCQLDGDRIAAAGNDGAIRLWSFAQPDADPILLRGHPGFFALNVCPLDGDRVASAGADGSITVWSLAQPDVDPILLRGHSGAALSVCSLDGDRIAYSSYDGTIHVLSLGRRTQPIVLEGHSGPVWCVCQLDSDRIASSGDDGTVRIWSLNHPKARPIVLEGHQGRVWGVCPLGDRIASCDDSSIHIWSLTRPIARLVELKGHAGSVWGVCSLGNGRIASTGADGVRVWTNNHPTWVALTLKGNILVTVHADPERAWPVRVTRRDHPWQTTRLGNVRLPSDPELHQLVAFSTRDASRADDPTAPCFCVAIHEYPEAEGKLWRLSPDGHSLMLAWPTDPAERAHMRRWIFGPNVVD